MNKFKVATLIAICILAVSNMGCSSSKIGVVDPIRLFQESSPGKAGMDHLRSVEEQMQEQVELAQGMIDNSPKNKELQNRFQKIFMDYQQIINVEQQRVVEIVNNLIQKTLDDYRVSKGYSVLMSKDNLLSYASSDDVTSDIIAILNCSNIKFETVVFEPFNFNNKEGSSLKKNKK